MKKSIVNSKKSVVNLTTDIGNRQIFGLLSYHPTSKTHGIITDAKGFQYASVLRVNEGEQEKDLSVGWYLNRSPSTMSICGAVRFKWPKGEVVPNHYFKTLPMLMAAFSFDWELYFGTLGTAIRYQNDSGNCQQKQYNKFSRY